MSDIVKETINKGVPVATPIILPVADLLNLCSNKKKINKLVDDEFIKYLDYIYEVCDIDIDITIDFFESMQIATDKNNLNKYLIFSPTAIFNSLYIALNVDDCYYEKSKTKISVVTNTELSLMTKNMIEERCEVLKSIENMDELEEKFPILAKKYNSYLEVGKQINNFINAFNDSKLPLMKRLQIRKDAIELYKRNGLNFSRLEKREYNLNGFIKTYVDFFEKLSDNIEQIYNYSHSNPLDLDQLVSIDQDKFALFMANQFMKYTELSNSHSQTYIYYVSNYFFEDEKRCSDDNLKIKSGGYGNKNLAIDEIPEIEITPKSLFERYKNYLIKHPEIKIVNFKKEDFSNMTLEEVEEFMDEYVKDLEANWDFLPENKYNSELEKKLVQMGKSINGSGNISTKSKTDLIELYMEKKEFYDSTDPYHRILGKNTFEGYIGYIYKNGTVVLDKLYEDTKQNKVAENHAIYIMNINDFYTLSNLSKNTIIRNKLCRRFIHKGDWKGRVLKVINENVKAEPQKEVANLKNKQLIKNNV